MKYSLICLADNNIIYSIKCFHSSPEEIGYKLLSMYNNRQSVENLIDVGDISSFGDTADDILLSSNRSSAKVYYLSNINSFLNRIVDTNIESVFIFTNDKWIVYDTELSELKDLCNNVSFTN